MISCVGFIKLPAPYNLLTKMLSSLETLLFSCLLFLLSWVFHQRFSLLVSEHNPHGGYLEARKHIATIGYTMGSIQDRVECRKKELQISHIFGISKVCLVALGNQKHSNCSIRWQTILIDFSLYLSKTKTRPAVTLIF